MTYTIRLNYTSTIVLDVEANNEGEALSKARELAETAPMSSFSIVEEQDSSIVNIVHND